MGADDDISTNMNVKKVWGEDMDTGKYTEPCEHYPVPNVIHFLILTVARWLGG